jgi:hypothetical protein
MEKNANPVSLKGVVESIRSKVDPAAATVTVYRFDIFKGVKGSDGKVSKIKSVGSSYIREGLKTYTVHLKALLKDTFYLLPNTKPTTTDAEFVILTREPAQNSGKKYFWNNVGEGRVLDGVNHGLMQLSWDVLMADDIYMTLHPLNVSELPEALKLASEAA